MMDLSWVSVIMAIDRLTYMTGGGQQATEAKRSTSLLQAAAVPDCPRCRPNVVASLHSPDRSASSTRISTCPDPTSAEQRWAETPRSHSKSWMKCWRPGPALECRVRWCSPQGASCQVAQWSFNKRQKEASQTRRKNKACAKDSHRKLVIATVGLQRSFSVYGASP